jgi:hypothetical protein
VSVSSSQGCFSIPLARNAAKKWHRVAWLGILRQTQYGGSDYVRRAHSQALDQTKTIVPIDCALALVERYPFGNQRFFAPCPHSIGQTQADLFSLFTCWDLSLVTFWGICQYQKKERFFATVEFNELSDSKRFESPDYEKKVSGIELNVSGDE